MNATHTIVEMMENLVTRIAACNSLEDYRNTTQMGVLQLLELQVLIIQ